MSGISAQGSTLQIATGSGGAKTITAITPGNPTIFTSAGHGLTNGTAVALAGIVGTIAAQLNGEVHIISNVTANTFALLDEDTTGMAYTSGGTATPQTYTKINGIVSFDGFDGSANELDTTDLDSLGKEFISGIKDEGKFGYEAKVLKADAGQIAVRANRTSGAVVGMKLTLPDTSVATFNVIVKTIPTTGGVDAILKGKTECRISGLVIWS